MKKTLLVFCLLTAAALAQGPSYPYSVALSCTPPTGQAPSGYNFYRAPFTTTCGSFAKLTTTPATSCAYTDQSPANGLYCYEVTDLDANNNESAPDVMSGHVAIPLPPPTGLGASVAKNANGTYDVIYAWKNPPGVVNDNTIYANGAPIVKVLFPTTKVRVTSPAGVSQAYVTDTSATGESAPSNSVKVNVP